MQDIDDLEVNQLFIALQVFYRIYLSLDKAGFRKLLV